jgi:hypothetical protein
VKWLEQKSQKRGPFEKPMRTTRGSRLLEGQLLEAS